MKITIPVFDSYIEKCKSTGVKPIFESFTEEHTETITQVDPALFEAYQAYKEDTRIISILEYQSIKSYSEFLENEEELANMPEDEEEEVEDSEDSVDNEEEVEAGEESEEDDDDEEEEESEEEAEVEDSEAATDSEESEEDEEAGTEPEESEEEEEEVEEAAEIKKAEHGPEKEAKVKELPATDDDFGTEIDIEGLSKDIDASFKEIEDEIMKMGEPNKEDEKDGEKLVGEEEVQSSEVVELTEDQIQEAAEETNIIVDFLFRRPKIQKTIKKATGLKVQAAQAETKAQEMIAKKNEEMDAKIAQLKEKGASSEQITKFKDKFKENIKKFEETLDKKIDVADDAAKEINDEADEMAVSNYLKKVLSKARVDGSLEVAKAKFAAADETEQAELKDRMKEMQMDAAELQTELDQQDGEAKKKVKDLGLSPDDYETLDKINTDLDNIKDKEKIVSNKIANAKEDKEKEGLQKTKDELDTKKFDIWTEEASKILDRVKDKEKRGSMYRTLTGVSEISNKAELEDYVETKAKEAEERGKAPGTQAPGNQDTGNQDTGNQDPGNQDTGNQDTAGNKEQKKKEIDQKLSTATSKLEGAKRKLGELKNDPSADPKAVSAIENNIKSLDAEVTKLNDEKGNLGESTEIFELNLNNLISKIDEVVNSLDSISTRPVNESNSYESVAQRFRKAWKQ